MFFDFNKKVYKKDSWSELQRIELNDLDLCMRLENNMLSRMHNKEYACSYIRKREREEFEKSMYMGRIIELDFEQDHDYND